MSKPLIALWVLSVVCPLSVAFTAGLAMGIRIGGRVHVGRRA